MECSKSRVHNRENLQGTESRFKHEHEFELLMQRMQALWTELIMEWNVKARSPNLWVLAEMLQTILFSMSVFCENNAPSSSPLPYLSQLLWSQIPISDSWVDLGKFPAPYRYRTGAPTGLDTSALTIRLSPFPRMELPEEGVWFLCEHEGISCGLRKPALTEEISQQRKKRHLRQAEFRQAVEVK